MSVLLTTPPPLFAFSSDFINAKFTCQNYLSQAAVFSVNTVEVYNAVITLKYGVKQVIMSPVAVPDDSGFQYASAGTLEEKLVNFQNNYQLNQDFNITISGGKLLLTAKKANIGFDIIGYNTTPGLPEKEKPNYTLSLNLYCENIDNSGFELIYSSNLNLLQNEKGMISASLGDKLDDYISKNLRENYPDIPAGNSILCKKSCRRYYFEYAERSGQTIQVNKVQKSPVYTVLHGGLSYTARFNSSLQGLIAPGAAPADRFLKQGNNAITTRTNQPQYLYYFNSRETFNGGLEVLIHYKDGSAEYKNQYFGNFESLRKYAFDVSYDQLIAPKVPAGKIVTRYEVRMFGLGANSGDKSEVRSYYLNYEYKEYVRYFLSWSSFGSMDTRLCYGKGNSDFELNQKEAGVILQKGYDIKRGNSYAYDLSLKSGFKVATGWMSRRELIANRDFFLSAFKYRFTRGLMLPIRIDSKTVPEIEDGKNLFAQVFEYSYQFDDHNFTEGDDEESGVSFGDFFFNSDPVGNPTQGITERDPTVPSWVKSITQADIDKWNAGGSGGNVDLSNYFTKLDIQNFFSGSASIVGYHNVNWDTAFTWGNHAGLYKPVSYVPAWSEITAKPTSLAGYAISDAYTKSQVDQGFIRNQMVLQVSAAFNVKGGRFDNYLTVPLNVPEAKVPGSLWIGEGVTAGTPGSGGGSSYLSTLLDVTLTSPVGGQSLVFNGQKWINQNVISAEQDPTVPSWVKSITQADINKWNLTAGGPAGYHNVNWDTAYSWGNHAGLYKLLSYVPAWSEITAKPTSLAGYAISDAYTKAQVDQGFIRNQTILQVSAAFNVKGGRFDNYLTVPLNVPDAKVAGSLWIGEGASAGTPGSGGGSSYLSTLLDVTLTGPASGQALVYNGTRWVNQNVVTDLSQYYNKSQSDARFLAIQGTATNSTLWNGRANDLSSIYDVAPSGGAYLGINSAGIIMPYTAASMKAFLGLGSGAYNDKTKLWSVSHPSDFYISNTWDGTYWQLSSNHGAAVNVGHSNNSELLNGYVSAVTPTANTIARRDASGYIEAAFFKSAVSAQSANGSTPVSLYGNLGADGYHYSISATGVKAFLGLTGNNYVSKNANSISAAGTADTYFGNVVTFAYNSSGSLFNGTLLSVGGFDGGYDLQINGSYADNKIGFRNRNGDYNGSGSKWHGWQEIFHSGNLATVKNYLNETLDSVTTRGNATPQTMWVTGVNRPVGRPSGKGLYIQQEPSGAGTLESYDYATSAGNPLNINPNGGLVTIGNNLLANGSIQGQRGNFGYDSGVANSVNSSDWFRTIGANGWYNATYQGGIHMSDTTYVRVYGGKQFLAANDIRVSAGYGVGFTMEDGFAILRQNGYTQFSYGGLSKMALHSGGLDVVAQLQAHTIKATNNLIMPTARPSSPVPGSIWIA